MPKHGVAYPQVEFGARGLIDTPAVLVPESMEAEEALRKARARGAAAVIVGRQIALREDLARAAALGLGALAVLELARPVPVVSADTAETSVRRALAGGAPAVLVRGDRTIVGTVVADRSAVPGPALGAALGRLLPDPFAGVVRTVRDIVMSRGEAAFLVGGVVRDLVGRGNVAAVDLDIVVEGDAHAVARALAEQIRGFVVLHERFLTATVELDGGAAVDVVTARSERYERPGALPRVMPAAIGEDLQRRDFTVNAMAIELVSGDARLLDPHGGRADAARRHVRVLHPLSFVEDPTRLFRAARYAARLGYALDQWTARCARLAVRHAPYAALSGTRIVTEIDRIVEDARPGVALRRLGTGGVFRLLDRRYRFTGRTALRLDQIETAIARARALDPHARLLDLVLLTLLEDQPPDVRATALRRLGLDGEPFARLLHALDGRPRLLAALRDAATPSARARLLRRRTTAELVWLTLGDDDTRRAVEHFASGEHGAVPVLRGEDVIGLGVPRGPEVARVLGRLRDARLDGVVQDRDAEADYVRRWLDTGKGD